MLNDKELKAQIRKDILKCLKESVESGKDISFIVPVITAAINSKKDESSQDVVLCEDEDGTTVLRVREGIYEIPAVKSAWADSDWWENNPNADLPEIILAVAYDYLLDMELAVNVQFNDLQEAAGFVYDLLNKIENKDSFVEHVLPLLSNVFGIK